MKFWAFACRLQTYLIVLVPIWMFLTIAATRGFVQGLALLFAAVVVFVALLVNGLLIKLRPSRDTKRIDWTDLIFMGLIDLLAIIVPFMDIHYWGTLLSLFALCIITFVIEMLRLVKSALLWPMVPSNPAGFTNVKTSDSQEPKNQDNYNRGTNTNIVEIGELTVTEIDDDSDRDIKK